MKKYTASLHEREPIAAYAQDVYLASEVDAEMASFADCVNTGLRDMNAEECDGTDFEVLRNGVDRIVFAGNRRLQKKDAEIERLKATRDGYHARLVRVRGLLREAREFNPCYGKNTNETEEKCPGCQCAARIDAFLAGDE